MTPEARTKRFAADDGAGQPCRSHREPVLSAVETLLRGRITDRATAGGSTLAPHEQAAMT